MKDAMCLMKWACLEETAYRDSHVINALISSIKIETREKKEVERGNWPPRPSAGW